MFENVREPTGKESELLELLSPVARYPNDETIFAYISTPLGEKSNESNNEGNDSKGSEDSGGAIPSAENSHAEAGAGKKGGELKQILGKRRAKS